MEHKKEKEKKREQQRYEYVGWDAIPIESAVIVASDHRCYFVSPEGDIYSYDTQTDKIRKMHPYEAVTPVKTLTRTYYVKSGYLKISLVINGREIKRFIHRLVAMCFCENDDPVHKVEVDHKDGNRRNNRRENLEWVTRKENQQGMLDRQGWKPYSEDQLRWARSAKAHARAAHSERRSRMQEVNLFN